RSVVRPIPRGGRREEAKIRETRGKRASLNGDRRGEDKGGYSFKLWWPSYEWSRSCKTETARCQAASLERACWNAQERARTFWGLQQSFAAAANRNLFLHPSSKSWLAETIIGADETRSPITTYFHSYPFVPGGAVPLPPPLLNGINNPAAAAITPGLVGHLFARVKSWRRVEMKMDVNSRTRTISARLRTFHPRVFPCLSSCARSPKIANFRNSSEPRRRVLRLVLLVMKSGGQIKDGMPILKTAENATFRVIIYIYCCALPSLLRLEWNMFRAELNV
ncbi:hypothetical protein ALC62_01277, partial [Cyphomyrmex costatus]